MFAAAFITFCLVALFNVRPKNHNTDVTLTTPVTLFLLTKPLNATPHVKPIAPATISAQVVPRIKPLLPGRKASQTRANEGLTLIQSDITNKETPTISTSPTPLQWDSKSINKAYNDSKTEIQKMAERSGKEMNTPIKTKYEKFQTAAEQAATPDCLSPQSGGLGLLSIPVIIFAAATDKCKMP